ncbi:MAG: hypothetical protein KGL39_28705 [Patescibacteria group bacterium]|nr:hypothetical protein [Patescibacteria group bacterium]
MAEVLQPGMIGRGTSIGYSTTLPPTAYTVLANLFDASDPKQELAHVETTTYASTDKEFIPGLLDNGEVSLKLNYTGAVASIVQGLLKQTLGLQITKADGATINFYGFFTSVSGANPVDGRVTFDVGIKVTGTVQFVPAGGSGSTTE